MIQIRCVFKVGVFHLCILNKIYPGVLKMEITPAMEWNSEKWVKYSENVNYLTIEDYCHYESID